MFTPSAHLYDALHAAKDYAAEAEALVRVVAAHRRSGGDRLLDVTCGTGKHLEQLRGRFAVEGLDLDPAMLAVAARRLPGVPLHVGDMQDFDLGRRFDVVVCLFGSIGYARRSEGLRRAVAAMARHLAPGGVLVVEPWLTPEENRPGHVGAVFVDEPNLKVARMRVVREEDGASVLDFHYLVATEAGVAHFTEHHEIGLFRDAEYRDAFVAAGLDVVRDPVGLNGRGLYVGVRPGQAL